MAIPQSKRSPAFQFYPRDFLSSRKVDRMSMTERGMYITLLSHCWIDRGLPTDMGELAATCRMKPDKFERIWTRGTLSQCFEVRADRFVNPRLEVERRSQAEYSKKQREKAEKRWVGNASALPHPSDGIALNPSQPIPSQPIPKKIRESAEPPNDSTPGVLTFQTVGNPHHPTWALTQGRIDTWQGSYPGLDVLGECRRALAWVEAKPERRKTAKGMPAFIVNWLNRTVERGGARPTLAATGTEGRGRTGAPPKGKYDGIEEHD